MIHCITLLRHGESEADNYGVLQGQTDYPLTTNGIELVLHLASFWMVQDVKFDLVISSPFQRASQTAQIIVTILGSLIQFDHSWMERNIGVLQGKSLEEISQHITPGISFIHITQLVNTVKVSWISIQKPALLSRNYFVYLLDPTWLSPMVVF